MLLRSILNFQSSVSFVHCAMLQSVFNEESNNLNWEPVDNMVPELWPFIYRHANNYWVHPAIYVNATT